MNQNIKIQEQVENILEFLQLVHPGLNNDKLAIEIRPIQRSGEYSFPLSKSLNIWRFDEKAEKYLTKFLEKHQGQPSCLYYSVFRFDTDTKAKTASGKTAQHGKITTMTAEATDTIVFDFDHIDEKRRRELVLMFEEYNLELSWVFSGHGFQGLLHLNETLRTPSLIKMLVDFFNSKEFGIDENCVDSARVMRLPFTVNNKNPEEPVETKLVSVSYQKYPISSLLSLLETPTESNEEITKTKGNLSILKEYDLPEPIKAMLTEVHTGYRNSVLGFLVGFLRTNLGFGHKQLHTLLKQWAEESCVPSYPVNEFKRDFDRFYYSGAITYSKSLSDKFGFINFQEYALIQKRNYIYLNNQVFDLTQNPGELRALLIIKLIEHGGQQGVSIQDMLNWAERNLRYKKNGLSINTLRKDLKSAMKNKLLYRKWGNKKNGEPDLYFSNQLFNISSGNYLIPANDIDVFVSSLNLNQLRLYLYLSYLQSIGVKYISQQKLAGDLNISRPRISSIIKELEEIKFLEVERKTYKKAVLFCKYTLLR